MLAEGIMLYILLVRVFGNLADKWYLLLPIGWGILYHYIVIVLILLAGLPIIIVGISVGARHDLYGTETQLV